MFPYPSRPASIYISSSVITAEAEIVSMLILLKVYYCTLALHYQTAMIPSPYPSKAPSAV
eukprot:scaffold865_cov87-Cylindrotheca_fusiformis.AAC.3